MTDNLAIFPHGRDNAQKLGLLDHVDGAGLAHLTGLDGQNYVAPAKDTHLVADLSLEVRNDGRFSKWLAVGSAGQDVVWRGPLRETFEEAEGDLAAAVAGDVRFA